MGGLQYSASEKVGDAQVPEREAEIASNRNARYNTPRKRDREARPFSLLFSEHTDRSESKSFHPGRMRCATAALYSIYILVHSRKL